MQEFNGNKDVFDRKADANMEPPSSERLKILLERLTGQVAPINSNAHEFAAELLDNADIGLGYSQFNELLLSFGYDRVHHQFFRFLVNAKLKYDHMTIREELEYVRGLAIKSLEQFENGVNEFVKLAMVQYGNVKYAFKELSYNADNLLITLTAFVPKNTAEFENRHEPIHKIEPISGEDTYYLGYLIEKELEELLEKSPDDANVLREANRRMEVIAVGKSNYESYLLTDHLDVYVATSMRKKHEYYFANEWVTEIFQHRSLRPLRLRYFDPTQAYCLDRVDKGISEALMLRRAKCTVYFVQESDTFGKDSELASTLAQGKVVIAFVPNVDAAYFEDFLSKLQRIHPDRKLYEIILEQLQVFDPDAAWKQGVVRKWLDDPEKMDVKLAKSKLNRAMKNTYDKRAMTLSESHPLGIQVNLVTGVANGVLVVRSLGKCAELIRKAVLEDLDFEVEEKQTTDGRYLLLRETISGCIFRVVTGNKQLTNTFWNFYAASR